MVLTLTEYVTIMKSTDYVSNLIGEVIYMVHENVEKIRIAKGVTKTFIANKLDLSLQGYRHIAQGNVRLDTERLKVIGDSLGVDPAVFLSDELTQSVIDKMTGKIASTA